MNTIIDGTMKTMPRLHFYPHTRATRARWMLEELGLRYDLNDIDLRSGKHKSDDHLKVHPLGKVPALEIDGAVILESLAICLYLADRYWEAELAPVQEERPERVRYLSWMAFSCGTLEPAILEQVRNRKAADRDMPTIDMGPALTPFDQAAKYIEQTLAQRPFLLGTTFTAADIINGSMMIWADGLGLLEGLEKTKAWVGRLRERPAYQRAMSNE